MTERPSFDQLIDQYSPEILGYLWRLVGDPRDAEDVFQDTFLRAYVAYPRLNHTENLRAWLYRVATNTAYTHLARRSRRQQRTADLPDSLPEHGPSLLDHVASRQALTVVQEAIEALPMRQRAALVLRKVQGMSYQEIGAVLDCSPEAARANLYQGLRKLRTQLSEEINP